MQWRQIACNITALHYFWAFGTPIAPVLATMYAKNALVDAGKFMQADNPTLTEKLATAIADGILNGTLAPGLRLDELTLAQQHGVSRTPVREALRQLAMSGLIDMRPRKGAIVSKATPERGHGGDGGDVRPARRHEHDTHRAAAAAGKA